MNFLSALLNKLKSSVLVEKRRKEINDYKREILLKQGQEQFKTLIRKGLSIPVTLL